MHRAPLALLALLLVLAGCGGTESSPTADSGTRTITDARGTRVEVPAAPRRVVALSEPTLDTALAVGVKPVATTSGRGQKGISGYLGRRAAGIRSVGILGQPNLEQVAALAPDLILVDGTSIQDDALLDKLRGIAPLVYVSKTGEDWRTAFTKGADALGRGAQAKDVLARFDARVARVKAGLGANARAEVSIVRWGGIGLPAVLKQELMSSRVLAALGLRRPSGQDGRGPGHSVPVSLENLDQIDGDWMFLGALEANAPGAEPSQAGAGVAAAEEALEIAPETPGFTRLRAYRERHVVPVDGSAWTSAGGVLAAQVVLDDVERALAPAA